MNLVNSNELGGENMKIKVDVITLHAVQNYGSVLQALATQKLLEKHGCEVQIINYIRENVKYENLLETRSNGNFLKKIILYPNIKRWKKVFAGFCNNYLNLTEQSYTTEKDFEQYPLDADIFCTGSDQVWNSKWNLGIILPLYLSFVPADRFKFSLAASFGQDQLSQEEINATKEYIDEYNFISVREQSGKEIIEEQYKYPHAEHVIDPTLTFTGAEWRKFAGSEKKTKNYILIYNLNRSKEFDNYAKNLSKKTGLKLVRLCNRYDQFYRPGKSIIIPEIIDFIKLIDNAKYVLTDSFHATAFSMNMNTEPICIYPSEFGGRIESFLRLTNSMQRHVKDYHDFDVINRNVDFEHVNKIMNIERKKVDVFLENVLNSYKQNR